MYSSAGNGRSMSDRCRHSRGDSCAYGSGLRNMLDIKVFVDADADDRLIRVIARDCIERGRTPQMVIDRYQDILKPMHCQYIEPSKRYADLIVPQGGSNTVAINLLTDYYRDVVLSSVLPYIARFPVKNRIIRWVSLIF